jgi:chorismate-pyruvate lyase
MRSRQTRATNGPSPSELARTLSERILRADSATDELERWCRDWGIGDGRIVALCARDAICEAMDDDSLDALQRRDVCGKTRFRRVRLATAGLVVVDALNWYFPDHLTSQMRERLETTDIPFGRVIGALRPKRRTFLVRRYTRLDAHQASDPGGLAFEHRAVVHKEDATPLAVVHERFRMALVAGLRCQRNPRRPGCCGRLAIEPCWAAAYAPLPRDMLPFLRNDETDDQPGTASDTPDRAQTSKPA